MFFFFYLQDCYYSQTHTACLNIHGVKHWLSDATADIYIYSYIYIYYYIFIYVY